MGKLKKNYLYSVAYQILAIILPLITLPYVSRIIGSNGIGEYNYTYSIVYYFMIFAILGINNYGTREIAKVKDNKEELNKKFWSIYLSQLLTGLIVFVGYLLFIFFFANDYKQLFFIQIMYVMSCLLDLNWFFNGLEEMKITVTRNMLIKVLSLTLIFIFVKHKSDTYIYTIILSASTLLSNMYLFFYLKKYISKPIFKIKEILKHLYPNLILFIPVISMKIYKVMDKTMLGLLGKAISDVGIYSNSESIINIPMGIITALGNVMLPRLTFLYSKNENEKANNLFFKSFKFALFLSVPIMVGLYLISDNVSILLFGKEFMKCGTLIKIICPTILFMTISNVIRTQYFIPNSKDKQYIISIIIGAVVNFVFNIIFIQKYGVVGACIGTLLAEFVVMVFHIIFVNKLINVLGFFKKNIIILIKGIIMGLITYSMSYFFESKLLLLIVQIIVGCVVYFVLNIKYIETEVNMKKIFNALGKKVK